MQPEAKIGYAIRTALEARGAFVFKVHGSGMMMAGLPDLIVCYRGRYIGLEVKTLTGKVSKVQELILGRIRKAGGVAIVVRDVEDATKVLDAVDMESEYSDIDDSLG